MSSSKFLIKYLNHFEINLNTVENSEEYYSSLIFNDYIDSIEDINQINQSLIDLINHIYS